MSIIQDPAGAGAANVVDANTPNFTNKKAIAVAVSNQGADPTHPQAFQLSDGYAYYKATTSSDTQPISVVGLPLPLGAATEISLAAVKTDLDNIYTKQVDGNQKTQVTSLPALSAGSSTIGKVDQGSGGALAWKVDGSAVIQPISVTSLPLPTGAASSTLQTTGNSSLSSIDSKTPTLGQKAMATSTAVVVASDQSSIPVSGPLTDTQLRASAIPINVASLPLPNGASTEASLAAAKTDLDNIYTKLTDGGQKTQITSLPTLPTGSNTIGKIDQGVGGLSAWVIDGSAVVHPISASSLPLPTGAATSTLQTTGNSSLSSIDGKLPAKGQAYMAGSIPVVIALDQNMVGNSAALTNVVSSTSSVTILASNGTRISAMIFNDSTAILYIKFGSTASTSSFTTKIAAGGYYEIPVGRDGKIYNGIIDGIWASVNGNARVTQIT